MTARIYEAAVSEVLSTVLLDWAWHERRLYPSAALGVMSGDAWSGLKVSEGLAPSMLALFLVELDPALRGLGWSAWPVILGDGGAIARHSHFQARRAAVAYLAVPAGAGAIIFDSGSVWPKARDVVLCDGDECHSVEAGKGPRVSVAVNFYGST